MTLKEEYQKTISEQLMKELNLSSKLAVPKLKKIVINMGVGRNRDNKQFIEEAINDVTMISGQKPSLRKAKVSISNFKLRQGQLAGISVTLRGDRMWDFYEKLVKIVFPRMKDFRGISPKSFDGNGNYNIGFTEHIIFPEIDANKVSYIKPLQVTISTSAKNDEEGYKLLKALYMPFKDVKSENQKVNQSKK